MLFKFPKDDKYFSWTSHVKNKMLQYRLSEQKIRTVLKNYERKEEGIAPKTTAVMKRNDKLWKAALPRTGEPRPFRKNGREEIWVMYQKIDSKLKAKSSKLRVISAWRYPGISPKGMEIPIPRDILEELEEIVKL